VGSTSVENSGRRIDGKHADTTAEAVICGNGGGGGKLAQPIERGKRKGNILDSGSSKNKKKPDYACLALRKEERKKRIGLPKKVPKRK